MTRFIEITENAGNAMINIYRNVIHMIFLWSDTVVSLLTVLNPFYKGNKSFQRQVSFQILFTGVEAFWLIGVIALMCGGTVIIQAINNMPNFGVGEYFGKLLKIFVVREIGPIVTFLLVMGRSGTALTAYLGNMCVNKEITALEAMGIRPVDYLVMPTFVGMVLSMICLNFYFAIIAIVGGLAVAEMTIHIPFMIYLQKAIASISIFDVYFILGKSIISGMVISIVSCFYGLSVNNIREVSMVVIKSFVVSGGIRIVIKIIVIAAFFRLLFPEAKAFFG
jgi:phospholipid/cholesterol/gamma-HCH transport system permease protein